MEQTSRTGFGIIGSIIIVAVVVLLGGGFSVFKYKQYLRSIEYTGRTTPIQIQEGVGRGATSSDESTHNALLDMTGWKTYRNEKYGFEVRYPASFKEYKNNDKEVRIANFAWEEGNYNRPNNAVLIYIYGDTTFQQYPYILENYTKSEKNFSLDGTRATKVIVKDSEREDVPAPLISVQTIKNDVYYVVEMIPWNKANEELFDKILSTFKFTK